MSIIQQEMKKRYENKLSSREVAEMIGLRNRNVKHLVDRCIL